MNHFYPYLRYSMINVLLLMLTTLSVINLWGTTPLIIGSLDQVWITPNQLVTLCVGLFLIFTLICCFLIPDRYHTFFAPLICCSALVGIIGCLRLMSYFFWPSTFLLIALLILTIVYFAVLLYSNLFYNVPKTRSTSKKLYILWCCIIKSISAFFTVMGIVFFICLISVTHIYSIPITSKIIAPTDVLTYTEQNEHITLTEEEMLLQMFSDFESLSFNERVDFLQLLSNIEAKYLGIQPIQLVILGDMSKNTYGYYSPYENHIAINRYLVKNEESYETLVKTVCHEMRHVYQHAVVNFYQNNDFSEEEQQLLFVREFETIELNLSNYISGDDSYHAYANQYVEDDANQYSYEALYRYYNKLHKYLNVEN